MLLRTIIVCLTCCRCWAANEDVPMDFENETARGFAALASVSYCADVTHVMDWTCKTCIEAKNRLVPGKIKIIDDGTKNATRTLIGKLRDQPGCLLAFRGSDNVENWVRDFQIYKLVPKSLKYCEGCQVHSGFLDMWNNIEGAVVSALREVGCSQEGTDNLLYITGHSLGAAVTHLAMFALDDAKFNIAKTYSFESPRVGNDKFAAAFDALFGRRFPVFRITHAQDPAVHVPPEFFGFTHVQTEVWYDRAGSYTVCPGIENETCSDRYGNVPWMLRFHAKDHCNSPLVKSGTICEPDCSSDSVSVIV